MTSATEILQHGWLWSIVLSAAVLCLVWFGAREAKGHGVPEVIYAVSRTGGSLG